ncbi:DUF4393 domain-containing protein [Peribacillus butanolivorans]|uniref:DUF4393 domain-containing protein n=1 Tax=Peribacillus butanolivorans TaxID=421767 RepID=UPI00369CF388
MKNTIVSELVNQVGPLLQNIYTDLAQPGVKKVGIALETVLDLSNTILFPIKLLNERTKLLTQRNMQTYQVKLDKVPIEDIVTVPPELGIPILEKLTYITNETIADLFTSLLTSASTTKTAHLGHPGFLRVLENLSIDEAKLIHFLSKNKSAFPCISMRAVNIDNGYKIETTNLTGLEKRLEFEFPDNDDLYLDNLTSLGIIEYFEDRVIANEELYSELEHMYSHFRLEILEEYKDSKTFKELSIIKGSYNITGFGRQFLKAISTY